MKKGIEIQLIGRLGADPEARYTPDGVMVTSFPVAVSKGKDSTLWVRVTAWRELGELCHQYLQKGRQVWVRGFPQVYAFAGQDGKPTASLQVQANEVVFLGDKKTSQSPLGEEKPETADILAEEDEVPF